MVHKVALKRPAMGFLQISKAATYQTNVESERSDFSQIGVKGAYH